MPSLQESNAFVSTFEIEPYQDGELSGLTFAVKDSIDIAGHVTGNGNPTWVETHQKCLVNAPCVDQLLGHGAACQGKTMTDEFTFGLDGENVHYGTPLNPHTPDRVPGGSSSGSASAVACGLVDFALGTDCGGSVRVPASHCGLYGMRPSFGTVSLAGVMPLAPSYDTVGVFAANYEVLNKVASSLLCVEAPLEESIATIYFVKEAFALADDEVKKALDEHLSKLKEMHPGVVKEISLHMLVEEHGSIPLHHWLEIFTYTQSPEIWSSLGQWIETVQPKLGERIKSNFEFIKGIDRTKLGRYTYRREWYFELMSSFLKPNDLLCFPTTPKLAPLKNALDDPLYSEEYFSKTLSICSIAGICRLPEITLPLAQSNGVPVGLSLAGAHRQDAFLLWAAGNLLNTCWIYRT